MDECGEQPLMGARRHLHVTIELPGVVPKQQFALFPYVSSTYDNAQNVQENELRAGAMGGPGAAP